MKPNVAPASEPRSSPTQTTAMSVKSGLAPRMRTCGATVACSTTVTRSMEASRPTSRATPCHVNGRTR